MARKNGSDNGGGDYEIGYGKPPKHSRWRKGQSGNPRGPKKGSRGLKKDLHRALDARHSITINGKPVSGTTQELALYALAARAALGDIRAIKQLIEVTLQVFGPDDRGGGRNVLPKQDQELLDRLFEEMNPEDPGGDGEETVNQPKDPECGSKDGDENGQAGDEA